MAPATFGSSRPAEDSGALHRRGFTLVEVLIAMSIAGLVVASVLVAFQSQRRTHYEQQMIVEMHQNVRAALFMIQRDVRMAGFDPRWQDDNCDGRHDERRIDGIDNNCNGAVDDIGETLPAGFIRAAAHRIWFRLDRNGDGDFCDSQETVAYGFPRTSGGRAADRNQDGVADRGAARLNRGFTKNADAALILDHPVADNIQAVAFAYGFDFDGGIPDGRLDTHNRQVIWAFDSDGDGALDRALDTDGDGSLRPEDDRDADGLLDGYDLAPAVPLQFVRAVRIWLLGRTRGILPQSRDDGVYRVGDKVIVPAKDGEATEGFRRVLLATTVVCRNLGFRRHFIK